MAEHSRRVHALPRSDVSWLSLDADDVRTTAARVVCLAYFIISIFLVEAYAGGQAEEGQRMEHALRCRTWGRAPRLHGRARSALLHRVHICSPLL